MSDGIPGSAGYDIPAGAAKILHTLEAAGFEAYLVGGCVRDLLRGGSPHDWDICTSAQPMETAACFPRTLDTGRKHGTITVMEGTQAYEVTTYRVDGPYSDGRRPDSVRFVPSLKEDLARRDFTMNAIAMDCGGKIQDPFGGFRDIQAGLIRCVGQPGRRFREDGLRIMRALRFAATLDYAIEEATAAAVHANRDMLKHVAAERINSELCKLLTGPGAGQVLRAYPDVLWVFWPELGPTAGPEQTHPCCPDGWAHTVRAIDRAPPDLILRLTLLLAGRFCGQQSSEAAGRLLRRLRFDRDTCRHVTALLNHCNTAIEPKTIRHLLHRLGREDFYRLLELRRAGGKEGGIDEVQAMADQIIAQRQCYTLRELAVSGRDVLAAGVTPGPEVGGLLNALLDRVMSGELPNQREALLREVQKKASGSRASNQRLH